MINIPPGVQVPTYFFHHLFSGLRRVGDLEWYLVCLGGAAGMRIIMTNYALAYGSEFDLGCEDVIQRVLREVAEGRGDGALNGAPCSTWSRARFAPGGPPPLRDRDYPWGRPRLNTRERAHCDLHSRLMKNGVAVLSSVADSGGLGLNEHPADPGRPPFPSIYDTAFFRAFENDCGFERVTFPQCAFGAASRKPTTLSGSKELGVGSFFGGYSCTHSAHASLIGIDESTGRFRTREAQTYPPEFCKRIAEMFVSAFSKRDPICSADGTDVLEQLPADELVYELGDRVPVPEVGKNWDPIDRWKETSRWKWKQEEHNNILEAFAALAAARWLAQVPETTGKRAVVMSDSQVVIAAFSKAARQRAC